MRVKGEILGNEDLDIDGTVEGLVHIDERKLTVGATAKLAADIIAGEVIVYGSVKGNVRGKARSRSRRRFGERRFVDGANHHRRRCILQGSIEIEQSAEKEGDRNVFSRTASASAAPAAGAGPETI
jgi:hypothetical protein